MDVSRLNSGSWERCLLVQCGGLRKPRLVWYRQRRGRTAIVDTAFHAHCSLIVASKHLRRAEDDSTMLAEQMALDPFSIRSLLTLPELDGIDSSTWRLSPFEKSLTPTTFALDIPEEEELQTLPTDLCSPNLDDISFPEIDSITSSTDATDSESDGVHPSGSLSISEDEDEVWVFTDVGKTSYKNGLLSWDNFVGTERNPAYLSEAAGGCCQQALCLSEGKHGQDLLEHLKTDRLQASLRELSLGRDSIFFCYDPIKATFTAQSEGYRPQDVSLVMLEQLVEGFLPMGNGMRTLRSSAKQCTLSSPSRIRAALSAAIGVAAHALESEMRLSSAIAMSSLHLQEIVRKPNIMVACLQTLVKHCPEDAEDITAFIRTCDTLCRKHLWLRDTLQEIVARSVSSQIENIGRSLGLGTLTTSSRDLVRETILTPISTGSLLAAEVAEVLIESQEAFALLQGHCPDHQLFTDSNVSRVNLQWAYTWEAISKLQTRAMEYEASFKYAILHLQAPAKPLLQNLRPKDLYSSGNSVEEEDRNTLQGLNHSGAVENMLQLPIQGYPRFGSPVGSQTALASELTASQDQLFQVVSSALSSRMAQASDLQPDLEQSMSLSLTPLLTAQHRLLSYSILSLLFELHDLKTHLVLQNRFQLLGDGFFASRLTRALFDSSEASGEGRRTNGGRTGLRLQSRESWPPASSELRLVLMGVLSESMSTGSDRRRRVETNVAVGGLGKHATRLESLSFAIRDLSDEDLEKCREVDTVHALDFLTLQYKPPSPLLETIITSQSLKLYDGIFIHLLRLLRVKSVAQELVTDVTARSRSKTYASLPKNHRTRLEIHRFIANLADWIQNTVIAQKWASFAATLDKTEKCLDRRDYDGALEVGRGLAFIKSLHEGLVDDIARTLFLKKRCAEVKAVLDRIFDIVLQVAKLVRTEIADGEIGSEAAFRRLYDNFRREAKIFLAYLHTHSSGSQGEPNSRGPEALMEQLALRLDVYGFYTDKV